MDLSLPIGQILSPQMGLQPFISVLKTMAFNNYLFLSATIIFIHKSCRKMRRQCFTLIQEKGKKRQTGWFPASYVKLLESKDAKAGNAAPAAAAATNAAAAEKFRAVHAFASQGWVH